MKKGYIILVMFICALPGKAQINPESIFPQIPNIQSVCGMRTAERDRYLNEIREIAKKVDDELYERRMDRKAKEKNYKAQAQANVAAQYGLSDADMAKMNNMNNMSKEQRERTRREMADKMMMNSGGISMNEIDQIKGDTAAQKAWAQGYATQKMAEQSIDPQQSQKEQMRNMNMYELSTIQKNLVDSLNAAEGKFNRKFAELEEDPLIRILHKEIDSIHVELDNLMGVDYGQGDQIEATFQTLKSRCMSYCMRFSPPYLDVLREYNDYTRESIPAWERLQVINTRITEEQTGVQIDEKPGTMALECIRRYITRLEGVAIYYMMSPALNVDGVEE